MQKVSFMANSSDATTVASAAPKDDIGDFPAKRLAVEESILNLRSGSTIVDKLRPGFAYRRSVIDIDIRVMVLPPMSDADRTSGTVIEDL
jgi:hypothetical protein